MSTDDEPGLCRVQLVQPGVTHCRDIIVAGQPLHVIGSGHRKKGAPVGNAPVNAGKVGKVGITGG